MLQNRIVFVVLFLMLTPSHVWAECPDMESVYKIRSNRAVEPSVIEALENQVATDPDDGNARAQLMSALWHQNRGKPSQIQVEQLLWLVEHCPRSPALRMMEATLSPRFKASLSKDIKAAWKAQLKAHPDDVDILRAAAHGLRRIAPEHTLELLIHALNIDPQNADVARELGLRYSLALIDPNLSDDERSALAFEGLGAFELALDNTEDIWRSSLLPYAGYLAMTAGLYDKARQYSKELLSMELEPIMAIDARHQGHTLQGLLAVREGQLKKAGEHLLESVAFDPKDVSPVLGSFGPEMRLAYALLEAGERDAVLSYFDACAKFWDAELLGAWSKTASAGEIPDHWKFSKQ